MLFNKVFGENEKCVSYFYLKTKGNFWLTQYSMVPTVSNRVAHIWKLLRKVNRKSSHHKKKIL